MGDPQLTAVFQALIGREDITPYLYQEKVAEHVLAGRNVIISAPTGAGKTWAAVLPFLLAWQEGKPIADRLLYALPLRTLATTLWTSTTEGCKKAGFVVSGDPDRNLYGADQSHLYITLQTGEQRDDPFLQGNIVFTTIDQLLSGYLNIPVSLSPKLSNINAGSLIGSVVVMDEIHLLEPPRSLSTLLEMVDRLRPYTRFIFMTATLSGSTIDRLKNYLGAETVIVKENDLRQMPSHQEKERIYRWVGRPLTAEAVLQTHEGGRSIVICNTVRRAQQIFKSLKERLDTTSPGTKLLLLHSRFFRHDRKNAEESLAEYFGPLATKKDAILVATQVVEAGIDISADNLHTELCPANSLLQRAGRCARYAERSRGAVWVYALAQTADGSPDFGPYYEKEMRCLVEATEKAIQDSDGRNLDFLAEQELINRVHQERERETIAQLLADLPDRRKSVNGAIDLGGGHQVRDLIRDVDSISIIIHPEPETLRYLDGPIEYLSVSRRSLWTLRDAFDQAGVRWVAKIPVAEEDGDDGFNWRPAASVNDLTRVAWVVALNPAIATYDPCLGLLLGEGGEAPEHPRGGKAPVLRPQYECESYVLHVNRVLEQGRLMAAGHRVGGERLEREICLPAGMAERLAATACTLHDAGKLSAKWQGAIRNWQTDRDPGHPVFQSGQPLAHSTYDGDVDRQRQRDARYDKGPHAAEGAFAVQEGLVMLLTREMGVQEAEGCAAAVTSAIARHHGGRTGTLAPFRLIEGAVDHVNQGMALVDPDLAFSTLGDNPSTGDCREFGDGFLRAARPEDEPYLPLYWFLVRRLRLADQASVRLDGKEVDRNCP